MADAVTVEIGGGGAARVTLNRPELHNAFDDHLIAALDRTLARLAADDKVRVVVLAAAGKSFSAGADLNWMKRMAGYGFEQNLADAQHLGAMLHRLASLPKPTLALVQGTAMAGGVGLLAACDIAIASSAARFALTEVRLGLIPATISPYVLRAIGARQALRYFLTAERFDADQAKRIGLVHDVVEPDDLAAAGARMVEQLLENGPRALAAAKTLIATVAGRTIEPALVADTARWIAEARASEEGREGVAAFLDKRRPRWRETES